MGALYAHTTRGIITLTPDIYNADHQNHIDNGVPALFDDYSASVAQMRLLTSPGGIGSESLATSLAGEIERLRYVLKALHGGAQWYSIPATPLGLSSTNPSSVVGFSGFNITGIPAGARRITVNLLNLANSGVSNIEFRLGTSVIQVGGYVGSINANYSASRIVTNHSNGHLLVTNLSGGILHQGRIVATLADNSNTWCITSNFAAAGALGEFTASSAKALPGALAMCGIQTSNGLDTFSSGSINLIYE